MTTLRTITLVALLALAAAATAQTPLGSEFTYHGRLMLNGVAVDGSVDIRFTLHTAASGGATVGSPYQADDVAVSLGVVSTTVDFGVAAFNGDERWLEIAVRSPHDPGDTQPFTTLDPRQELTVVPYALHALNGGGGGGSGHWTLDGSSLTNTNAGFVGVGRSSRVTSSEYFGVHSPVGTGSYGGMYLSTDDGGYPFYGYNDGNSTAWHYLDGVTGTWHLNNSGTRLSIENTGNVGIGIGDPTQRLQVAGVVHSTAGGFMFPDGTVMTSAGGGATGAEILLTDTAAQTTVEIHASSPAGANGAYAVMRNSAGTSTVVIDADSGDDSEMRLRNDAGITTVLLDGGYTAGNGGLLEVQQADGGNGIRMQAHGGFGEATNGAYVYLYDTGNQATLRLHADYQNTGESRVVTDVLEIVGGADLSEQFEISEVLGRPEPGSVVSIDPQTPGELAVSSEAYDRRVAGIVSGAGGVKPGMLMGQRGTVADGQHPVALTGRVYCKVDASFGAVQPGDLLTTSSTPGHAMKVADHGRAQGAILGKAMTALEDGRGMVLVLVSLQ